MVLVIKKGSKSHTINLTLNKIKSPSKEFNAQKYCGMLKLRKDPMEIQNQMRDEWE